MAQFNFSDYQETVAKAQNGQGNSSKVGFFRLKNDGDEALVRINCNSVNDLQFASVHTVSINNQFYKINCLNPIGQYSDVCPLCSLQANGNKNISKAGKKVYLQMLVSYKDRTTGTFTAPQPVIWERPAIFSKELANKLRDFGPLTNVLFKITRNGAAGDMKTTYSMDYAVPTVFKPEMIPMDFSAFDNFNIAKHSYWDKTAQEIITFLNTGAFPSDSGTTTPPVTSAPAVAPTAPVTPTASVAPFATTPTPNIPSSVQSVAPNMGNGVVATNINSTDAGVPFTPVTQPTQMPPASTTPSPRNFTGFKF